MMLHCVVVAFDCVLIIGFRFMIWLVVFGWLLRLLLWVRCWLCSGVLLLVVVCVC